MKANRSDGNRDLLKRCAPLRGVRDFRAANRSKLPSCPPRGRTSLGDYSFAREYSHTSTRASEKAIPEGLSRKNPPGTGRKSANCRVYASGNDLVIQSRRPIILRRRARGREREGQELQGEGPDYAGAPQLGSGGTERLMCDLA